MYVILVYDVNVDRVARVLKIARKYLCWTQNSVLEGEITRAQLERMKGEIQRVIDPETDSVLFYLLRSARWVERQSLGRKSPEPEWMI